MTRHGQRRSRGFKGRTISSTFASSNSANDAQGWRRDLGAWGRSGGASSGMSSFTAQRGTTALRRVKPVSVRASRHALLWLAATALAAALTGCGAQIDRHGHVFLDVDLQQIQPGMSKEQVQTTLGSPDTTSTIGGDAYYHISTTQKTVAFLKPYEIDRQVVAVYFDGKENVQQ